MNSVDRMNIKIKEELHEEVTHDDNGGEQMDALFSNETVKLENEAKKELPDEALDNVIDDNTKYLCELCKSYFPSLTSLQDHMQSHDSCDDKNDIKSLNDRVNFEETKNTEVKEASGEGNHREKPDDKLEERFFENITKRKRYSTEEKDYGINFKENDECELINLIMKDHIILGKKHHDGIIDKASVKNVKAETEDINKNDNDELVNLIMKDHIILRCNYSEGNTIKMKTETLRNTICEKSNFSSETSDGNMQIDNGLSETRHDTVMNVIDHDHAYDGNEENRKRRMELVSKEHAIGDTPPVSPHMPDQFDCNICNKSFENSKKFGQHFYIVHKLPVFCDFCPKKFSCKDYLDRHVKQVHSGIREEWKCKFCGNCYSYSSGLRRHITMFHCTTYKKYKQIT